jgi:hypothetical protein
LIFFVLICIGNTCKCELVVDGSRVIGKGVSQCWRHWRIVKRVAFPGEKSLNHVRKGIADWREPYCVVFAALVESYRPVPAFSLSSICPFFEPVCSATPFAMLTFLVD